MHTDGLVIETESASARRGLQGLNFNDLVFVARALSVTLRNYPSLAGCDRTNTSTLLARHPLTVTTLQNPITDLEINMSLFIHSFTAMVSFYRNRQTGTVLTVPEFTTSQHTV